MGILDEKDLEKQDQVLLRLLKHAGAARARPALKSKSALLRFALADKKTTSSSLRMSLPERIGKMHSTRDGSYKIPVPEAVFLQSIDYLKATTR